jgi:hypothetical protein
MAPPSRSASPPGGFLGLSSKLYRARDLAACVDLRQADTMLQAGFLGQTAVTLRAAAGLLVGVPADTAAGRVGRLIQSDVRGGFYQIAVRRGLAYCAARAT